MVSYFIYLTYHFVFIMHFNDCVYTLAFEVVLSILLTLYTFIFSGQILYIVVFSGSFTGIKVSFFFLFGK